MENLKLDDLQRGLAELKVRLARSIRQPTGHAPGHFADLAGDIETLEEMVRKIGPDAPSPRGKRSAP